MSRLAARSSELALPRCASSQALPAGSTPSGRSRSGDRREFRDTVSRSGLGGASGKDIHQRLELPLWQLTKTGVLTRNLRIATRREREAYHAVAWANFEVVKSIVVC